MACAEHIYELKTDMKILPKLDFIFAKASLAKEMKASMPEFNDQRQINIKKGRHPLLDPKKVVPIDIHLGKDFNLLIVTGPNTGGKTCLLYTSISTDRSPSGVIFSVNRPCNFILVT